MSSPKIQRKNKNWIHLTMTDLKIQGTTSWLLMAFKLLCIVTWVCLWNSSAFLSSCFCCLLRDSSCKFRCAQNNLTGQRWHCLKVFAITACINEPFSTQVHRKTRAAKSCLRMRKLRPDSFPRDGGCPTSLPFWSGGCVKKRENGNGASHWCRYSWVLLQDKGETVALQKKWEYVNHSTVLGKQKETRTYKGLILP